MPPIDHRKIFKHLYSASKTSPVIIEVPTLNYLMIDGQGRPTGTEFQQAANTLYPVAYTLKFMVRERIAIDYHVMPMEIIWKVNREKKQFAWTMLIMQPEYVTSDLYQEALSKVRAKQNPPLNLLRFESFTEGTCVQFLHTGPYEGMEESLEKMLAYSEQHGYTIPIRNTHDIYLNDVRKTRPENLKAIMRLTLLKK